MRADLVCLKHTLENFKNECTSMRNVTKKLRNVMVIICCQFNNHTLFFQDYTKKNGKKLTGLGPSFGCHDAICHMPSRGCQRVSSVDRAFWVERESFLVFPLETIDVYTAQWTSEYLITFAIVRYLPAGTPLSHNIHSRLLPLQKPTLPWHKNTKNQWVQYENTGHDIILLWMMAAPSRTHETTTWRPAATSHLSRCCCHPDV